MLRGAHAEPVVRYGNRELVEKLSEWVNLSP